MDAEVGGGRAREWWVPCAEVENGKISERTDAAKILCEAATHEHNIIQSRLLLQLFVCSIILSGNCNILFGKACAI